MISPEVIRRYPFFAGLTNEQIVKLADAAEEITLEAGTVLFKEGDLIDKFYILEGGEAEVFIEIPDEDIKQPVSSQLTGETLHTREVSITTIEVGGAFAWSGLIPPHNATAGVKIIRPSKVISFDCNKLLQEFEKDCEFAYQLTLRIAQVIRERMRALRIESLILHKD